MALVAAKNGDICDLKYRDVPLPMPGQFTPCDGETGIDQQHIASNETNVKRICLAIGGNSLRIGRKPPMMDPHTKHTIAAKNAAILISDAIRVLRPIINRSDCVEWASVFAESSYSELDKTFGPFRLDNNKVVNSLDMVGGESFAIDLMRRAITALDPFTKDNDRLGWVHNLIGNALDELDQGQRREEV